MITETPEVAAALDAAHERWPECASRSTLLVKLALEGSRMLQEGVGEAMAQRRSLLAHHAGEFAAVYGPYDEGSR